MTRLRHEPELCQGGDAVLYCAGDFSIFSWMRWGSGCRLVAVCRVIPRKLSWLVVADRGWFQRSYRHGTGTETFNLERHFAQ